MIRISGPWPHLDKYQAGNHLELLEGGEQFVPALERLVQDARFGILMQFYIFHSDAVGERILKVFAEAVRRSVKIHLLLDAVGSSDLTPAFEQRLIQTGVHLEWYHPLLPWKDHWGLGRRLHRKVAVADGEHAIIGGINVGQEYMDSKISRQWLDFAVDIQGPAARTVHNICAQLWNQNTNSPISPLRVTRLPPAPTDSGYVRPLQQNFRFRHPKIHHSYLRALRHAKDKILIANGYFLPGLTFRRALESASQRGVKIRLILAARSDVKIMEWATHALYSWLLKTNIEVYEWTKSNMHAKVAVVDGFWATVGSFNLDEWSLHANVELNADIIDPEFCQTLGNRLEAIMDQECSRVHLDKWRRRSAFWLPLEWIAYALLRFLVRLPVFSR